MRDFTETQQMIIDHICIHVLDQCMLPLQLHSKNKEVFEFIVVADSMRLCRNDLSMVSISLKNAKAKGEVLLYATNFAELIVKFWNIEYDSYEK